MFTNCKNLILITAILGLSACFQASDSSNNPKQVLSDYVSKTFSIKTYEERSVLAALTTGEIKESLEKLDAESFQEAFTKSKREFLSLKIRDERPLADDKYSITYELSYSQKGPAGDDRITNKKHALFKKQNGKWLVAEVKNLKTLIENQNEQNF